MVEFRPVCLDEDRDFIHEMYLVRKFEGEPEAERRRGFAAFGAREDQTSLFALEFNAIEASLQDSRTIADVIVVDGVNAGFVWVTFGKIPGRYTDFAELNSLALRLRYQRQGLGRVTMAHVEKLAAERGAESVRSTGSAPSEAVRRFHAAAGFEPIQTVFEKRLTRPA
jgi:GNAT superfamily N-acetyltransferase